MPPAAHRSPTRPRPLVALVALATWVLSASGCTSRTVPLPPPVIEQLSLPDEDGFVRVRGLCHEGASVGVLNEDTESGIIVTSPESGCEAACPFEARIVAERYHTIRVWQFFGTSSSIHVTVPGR